MTKKGGAQCNQGYPFGKLKPTTFIHFWNMPNLHEEWSGLPIHHLIQNVYLSNIYNLLYF